MPSLYSPAFDLNYLLKKRVKRLYLNFIVQCATTTAYSAMLLKMVL